jgi:hypothetical protein
MNNLFAGQYFNDKPIGVHEVSFANLQRDFSL